MQPILVIGPNGLVGKRVTPMLRAAGHTVRTAGRSEGADIFFDWARPETFAPALDDIATIYLAPPALIEDPSDLVSAFVEAAKSKGARRVVAVSSLGVTFPEEPSNSGRRKFESLVTQSGLEWTLLRPSGFMQNFSEGFALPGILYGGVVVSAAADGAVALVDADDIAAVAMATLTSAGHAGKRYPITGPAAVTFDEVAQLISEVSGRTITHQVASDDALAEMMAGAGIPGDFVKVLVRDQLAIRTGHAATVTTTVQDVTGSPPQDFATFALNAAPFWKSQ